MNNHNCPMVNQVKKWCTCSWRISGEIWSRYFLIGSVWPDWAIFDTSRWQIFFQNRPKYFETLRVSWITSFKLKTVCSLLWATFENFGLHLIPPSGHTVLYPLQLHWPPCLHFRCHCVIDASKLIARRPTYLQIWHLSLKTFSKGPFM